MRNIQESLAGIQSLTDYINNQPRIDEGLKDALAKAKAALGNTARKVVTWAKGLVAHIQHWFMVVDEDGHILPCSTPMTMGYAWKNGLIDKKSTFVGMGKVPGAIVGTSEPFANAAKNYPKTLDVWREIASRGIKESRNEIDFIKTLCESNSSDFNEYLNSINEVKLANEDPQAKYNVICDDEMLAKLIKAHALHRNWAKLMIWGAPGIGKTAILNAVVEQIAKEQGGSYNLIVKQLASETADNFFLPKYTDDGRATDVPKTWLPVYRPTGDAKTDAELDEKCGRGLLFLDELSRAPQQVQNVILPLINEGELGGWKLGSGWSIICASNRDEDEIGNGSQTTIGNALSNRFSQVYYEPTCKTWRKWAEQQGFISPLLIQWLDMPESESHSGGKYFYWDPNDKGTSDSPSHIMCTPRSWTNAMEQLAVYHETGKLEGFDIFDLDESIVKMILNKNVPAEAVDAFWSFLKLIRSVGDFDNAVHAVWKNGGRGLKISKDNIINVALPLAQLIICAHKNTLPTKEEFESLATWVVSTGSEQLCSYVLDIFKNVFGVNIPDKASGIDSQDLKIQIFFLHKLYDLDSKKPAKEQVWAHVRIFDQFFQAWGVTPQTMPDYSEGIGILSKKYALAFQAAQVDGRDGLG